MHTTIKDKLTKIYELVNHGATEGERQAAKSALDRMLSKFNLTEADLISINTNPYIFKYSNSREMYLLSVIKNLFLDKETKAFRRSLKVNEGGKNLIRVREIVIITTYAEWVQIECAYEYFRRHMNQQWKSVVVPILKNYKGNKLAQKNKRTKIEKDFMSDYLLKSKLYRPEHLVKVELSAKRIREKHAIRGIEGGNYTTQITSNKSPLLLN